MADEIIWMVIVIAHHLLHISYRLRISLGKNKRMWLLWKLYSTHCRGIICKRYHPLRIDLDSFYQPGKDQTIASICLFDWHTRSSDCFIFHFPMVCVEIFTGCRLSSLQNRSEY